STPFASICDATTSASPLNSASTKCICSSRSASTMHLHHAIRFVRLCGEHTERRDVRVPLDERRHRTEALERRGIQHPHFIAHRRVVRVDANVALADAPHAVASKMHLTN